MSCFTGPHADTDTMTTINYAGGFTEHGATDPIQVFMKEFLKEDVDFEMPPNVRSWKQRANVNMKGQIASKVTTRELRMKDGTTKELKKEQTKNI